MELLRQEFQLFWEYNSPAWAAKFLDAWCGWAKGKRAMRSRIDPVKQFAGTVRAHRELLLNYFRAKRQFSSGVIEGLNRQSHIEKSVSSCWQFFYPSRSLHPLQINDLHVPNGHTTYC